MTTHDDPADEGMEERDLAAMWDEEADRRFSAYLEGKVSAIPAKEGPCRDQGPTGVVTRFRLTLTPSQNRLRGACVRH